jgi:Ca-activated chloride channel homolog
MWFFHHGRPYKAFSVGIAPIRADQIVIFILSIPQAGGNTMHRTKHTLFAMLSILALLITACTGDNGASAPIATATIGPRADAIQISIVYAPESDLYLASAIVQFNQAYAEGRNPLTGQALAAGEKPIYITGKTGSSGTVMQGIVNAILAPNNANVERPTIYAPSVSHWLALANYQAGRDLFDLNNSPATALAPVVMAIWESRLEALKRANPGEEIGWKHLLEVINNPKGWEAYGFTGRQTVYYGHTDPYISSTGLSTLIAEFYASAFYNAGIPVRRLSLNEVRNAKVQEGVRAIESLIKHYSRRTTEFKEYIAQGPDYLDFVALEENDLIYINQGKTSYRPPERLVALYPAEGTFWHEHPFAIPNTDWVTPEQREAAKVFTQFILSAPIQQTVLTSGFRPANPDVPLGYPIVQELGVDPNQPKTVLEVPDPAVVAEIQQSWSFVKKQADIWLVIDISGSMRDNDKIGQARKAALAFLDGVERQSRIGLIVFAEKPQVIVTLDDYEKNKPRLTEAIQGLTAGGGTALYDALLASLSEFDVAGDAGRIRAVVVLSDGQDTESISKLNDVNRAVAGSREDNNPVIVIAVAYGQDADVQSLNSIARASSTKVQSGDPKDIQAVLQVISSYF